MIDNVLALMNAANFPLCYVATLIALTIYGIRRAMQRAGDRQMSLAHAERMEDKRLGASKELTVARVRPPRPSGD